MKSILIRGLEYKCWLLRKMQIRQNQSTPHPRGISLQKSPLYNERRREEEGQISKKKKKKKKKREEGKMRGRMQENGKKWRSGRRNRRNILSHSLQILPFQLMQS